MIGKIYKKIVPVESEAKLLIKLNIIKSQANVLMDFASSTKPPLKQNS